jgi:hypothetical protein
MLLHTGQMVMTGVHNSLWSINEEVETGDIRDNGKNSCQCINCWGTAEIVFEAR